jgi:uncharacterized protein
MTRRSLIDNPFRYGEIVRGPYFAGRTREKAELVNDIRSGQNVVLISPRRYGKSSLVLEALAELDSPEVLSAYVDLLRAPTYERLPDVLASALYTGLVSPLARTWQRVGDLFADLPLRPKFSVGSDGTVTVEFTGGVGRPDLSQTIERLLELPGTIATERKLRVALVIDEFQSVGELDSHLPHMMRAIFQHQADVAHVFLGSRRHLMARLFTDENEPMFRLAKPMLLQPLAKEEFVPFIQERFLSTKTPITDAAIERILDVTGGHPSDTQEICSFVWSVGYAAGRFPIPVDCVEVALDRVLDAESARFVAIWDRLPGPQRALLASIAAEPDVGIYGSDFRRRHRLGDPARVQRAAERLLDLGLIETVPGPEATYRVTDTFIGAWLRRAAVIS